MSGDRLAMRQKTLIYVCLTVGIVVVGAYVWKLTVRNLYESAPFKVEKSDGNFEIRQYPELMTVSTEMSDGRGNDGSFMRLFRYIDGKNEDERKIAMTTPVFMERKRDENNGQMAFVLPKKMAQGEIPTPIDEKLQIRKRAAGRFAVLKFSGRMTADSVADATRKLRDWIKSQRLTGDEQVVTAGYDPPWTPGPFRRNEVLIRLK